MPPMTDCQLGFFPEPTCRRDGDFAGLPSPVLQIITIEGTIGRLADSLDDCDVSDWKSQGVHHDFDRANEEAIRLCLAHEAEAWVVNRDDGNRVLFRISPQQLKYG